MKTHSPQMSLPLSAARSVKAMKLLLLVGISGLSAAINPGLAQAQPTLGVQLYAGVSIPGAVGTVYAIQATTNLTNTNSWITVNFIQLPSTNYLWTDTSTAASGRMFYRAMAAAPTNLAFIPPGTFRMGSPTNELNRNTNEGPQTIVIISKGFFMGKYQVTQSDYLGVVGSLPLSLEFPNPTYPINNVAWEDETNYCGLRTQQELAAGLIPPGSHYRLPTEAEWEYACRAGTSDRAFYYGDDVDYTNLTNYAWFSANSDGTPQPVGQKLPNQWGLYDMLGDSFQRCQDWYGTNYPGGITIDPQGPVSGSWHVIRGGGGGLPQDSRSASRRGDFGINGKGNPAPLRLCGFRVVLVPGQ